MKETVVHAPEGHVFTKSPVLARYHLERWGDGTNKTLCGRRIYPKKWRNVLIVAEGSRCDKCGEAYENETQ